MVEGAESLVNHEQMEIRRTQHTRPFGRRPEDKRRDALYTSSGVTTAMGTRFLHFHPNADL